MTPVKGANRKVARTPGTRYAKVLATHQRMEAELSRALNRWQKSRKALAAAEKRLDRLALTETEENIFSDSVDSINVVD